MSETSIVPGQAYASNPQNRFGTYRNAVAANDPVSGGGVSVDPGVPVAPGNPTGTGGTGPITIFLARGNNGSGQGSTVLGLAVSSGENPGNAQYVAGPGPLTLTTAQWDAVTGGSSGLVQGDTYYVGATPGTLSSTPPSGAGDAVLVVGFALSPTTMWVSIGANLPKVYAEHFTVNAGGTQAITPSTDVTFGNVGSGSGTATFTLAAGAYDGEQKTFHANGSAEVDIILNPAAFGDGHHITFSAEGGGGEYTGGWIGRWDAALGEWWTVALYNGTIS